MSVTAAKGSIIERTLETATVQHAGRSRCAPRSALSCFLHTEVEVCEQLLHPQQRAHAHAGTRFAGLYLQH